MDSHNQSFVAQIARQSVFSHGRIFLFSLLFSAAGLYSLLTSPVLKIGAATAVVFLLIAFIVPFLLSVMLRSFRKALVAFLPVVGALLLVPLTLFLSGAALAEPQAAVFVPVVLAIGSGMNYIILNSYFSERRRPTTVANAVGISYARNGRPAVGMFVILAVAFFSLSAMAETRLFGTVTALALTYSLIYSVLVMPALLNIYELRMARKALTPLESSVLGHVKAFGHRGPLASSLGVAARDIDAAVASLRRKGLLGPHFFSSDDPLVWFMLLFSFMAGAALAGPMTTGLAPHFAVLLALTLGVAMLARPSIGNRLAGIALILSSLYAIYQSVPIVSFPLGIVLALLGSSSAYLASMGILAIVSNVLAGAFYSAVFAYSWIVNGGPPVPPFEWLAAIAVVTFLIQLVLEEEVYVSIQ